MRIKHIKFLILLIIPVFAFTSSYYVERAVSVDEIKKVVLEGYVHGAFNELNPEAMAKAFHEDFAIFSTNGETLDRYEIEDWIEGTKRRKAKDDFDPAKNKWDHKFEVVDATGGSAMVKVELSKDGKLVYTDYLSLLKFDAGWRVVAKVYHKH